MALTQVSTGGIKDGQVQTADLADGQVTVGKLHADALDRTYTLGADGSNHYTFTGEGLTGAVNDPTLYLTRGKTYRFVNGNSAGAHPFRIQTTVNGSAGTEYNTGVTNNGGAGGSTIVFEVPHDAPDVLYYQCTSHNAMGGILYVTGALADGSVTNAKIASQTITGAKIANDAITGALIASNTITSDNIANGTIAAMDIADNTISLAKLVHGTSSEDGKFLRANNGADPTFETVSSVGGATGVDFNDSVKARFGTGNDLEIYHDGTHNYLNFVNGALIFTDNGTNRAYFHATDGHFLPWANNTYDLGSTTNRWRNIYTNDLNLSNEGSSNDVDGTWGDWTIQEGESDLFLKNNRSGKKYKFNLTEVS